MKHGLFVGRFQPFHNGHLHAVKFALGKVDVLWIAIGSAQKSYEKKNPFTAGERLTMIKAVLDVNKINPKRITRWQNNLGSLNEFFNNIFTVQ